VKSCTTAAAAAAAAAAAHRAHPPTATMTTCVACHEAHSAYKAAVLPRFLCCIRFVLVMFFQKKKLRNLVSHQLFPAPTPSTSQQQLVISCQHMVCYTPAAQVPAITQLAISNPYRTLNQTECNPVHLHPPPLAL
jgi:hypothetical protein